jgi:hypothetical protein
MLAELAAANAAYAVIKEAISNGGDILAAGSRLGEYFGLKSEISKRASQKGNNSESSGRWRSCASRRKTSRF